MHRYISIGQDNRYEHEVTPLGGTRMRIPVSSTGAASQRSAAGTYIYGGAGPGMGVYCISPRTANMWMLCLHEQTHVYRTGQQV